MLLITQLIPLASAIRKKRVALDVENVHAKCHITVVLQDKTWDLYRVKSSDMLGGAFGCFPFEGGYVGAVDE